MQFDAVPYVGLWCTFVMVRDAYEGTISAKPSQPGTQPYIMPGVKPNSNFEIEIKRNDRKDVYLDRSYN